MVADVTIGNDRIMLTVYNPTTPLTLLKCRYLLESVGALRLTEEGFHKWLTGQKGGAELLAKLEAGIEPPERPKLSVDPLNAEAEHRILAWLDSEREHQTGRR